MTVDELRVALEGVDGAALVRVEARYGSLEVKRIKYVSDREFTVSLSNEDD